MHESSQPRVSAARSLDEVLDKLWITLTHRRGEMVPREQLRELASIVSHEARSRGMLPEQLVVAVKASWRRHPKLRDAYFVSEPTVPARNCLLGLLPPVEADRLAPFLERCDAPLDEVLGAPDRPMDFVYFPESCVGSVINLTDDGFVEVGTVGNEGLLGLSVLLDADAMPLRSIWQVAGTAMRMRAADVRPLFDELPAFRTLLLRYAHAFLVQVAQTAACNRKHDLDQRCARWLLMTHDRVATDTFGLTQRLLGVMLGVHRPAVTICAQTFQRAGLITYTRGSITIVDRQGLEAASCECYVIVRDHFSRLCRTVA